MTSSRQPAPEGSVERRKARETVVILTETVLLAGNLSPEEWRDKLRLLHPDVLQHLTERDVDTIITMTVRQLALWRGSAGH